MEDSTFEEILVSMRKFLCWELTDISFVSHSVSKKNCSLKEITIAFNDFTPTSIDIQDQSHVDEDIDKFNKMNQEIYEACCLNKNYLREEYCALYSCGNGTAMLLPNYDEY